MIKLGLGIDEDDVPAAGEEAKAEEDMPPFTCRTGPVLLAETRLLKDSAVPCHSFFVWFSLVSSSIDFILILF